MSGEADGARARAVVRAPNHLGELILALPALEAAARRWASPPLVQVVERLVPALRLAGIEADVLPLAGRHRIVRAALELRRRAPDVGILLTPSLSAALIFALAGVRSRRGTDTDGRGPLLTERVDREPLLRGHRVREYLRLVDPRSGDGAGDGGGPGAASPASAGPGPGRGRPPPAPRLRRLGPARAAWRELSRREGIEREGDGAPVVGLVPGGEAPSRRWPAERYADLAARLAERGCRVRVFGGAGEEAVTGAVAGADGDVADLGGRTGLVELAGGLAACDAVVGNDTGATHLAAAAGRPVVVVWGAGDPRQTRPPAPAARLVGRFDLPCHPCVENACPRRGRGYVAEDARRECLALVTVDEVEAAAEAALADGGDPGFGPPGRDEPPAGGSDRERRGGRDA